MNKRFKYRELSDFLDECTIEYPDDFSNNSSLMISEIINILESMSFLYDD